MARTVNVGVLGATGTVGQRFIVLLSSHLYFKIHALGASSRSAGQKYREATRWKQPVPIPESVSDVIVRECNPSEFEGCDIVFSGLDSDVAGDIGTSCSIDPQIRSSSGNGKTPPPRKQKFASRLILRFLPPVTEEAFRSAELAVFSNAGNYRRDPTVPLCVPLVNPSHLEILPHQRSLHSPPLKKGCIVTNANCSTTGLSIPLHALEKAFGPLETVMVTTMQAISGAGYPGVSSLDILDNVVPLIGGEEEKMEWELSKILGAYSSESKTFDLHAPSPMKVSAMCNRVPVLDGHLECASVRFVQQPPPSIEEIKTALSSFTCEAQTLGCPSAPKQAIYVHEEPDRPQPRLDRYFQNGSGVNVGRIRPCPVLDVKFVVLVNNVSIGAATSSIINAEYAVAKNII